MIANQEYYRGLHRDLKERAADALLGEFEKLGARFLGVTDKMRFYQLDYDRTIEKFKHALREKSYTTPPIEVDETETHSGGKKGSSAELSISSTSRSEDEEVCELPGSDRKRAVAELFKGETINSPVIVHEDASVHVDKKQRTAHSGQSSDGAPLSNGVDGSIVRKFLSVGHFVNRFQDDKEEKNDEAVPALHEIRRAFRENHDTISSPREEAGFASSPNGGESDVEKLAQIYKPSPLRTIKRGTRTPIPIFFQGV